MLFCAVTRGSLMVFGRTNRRAFIAGLGGVAGGGTGTAASDAVIGCLYSGARSPRISSAARVLA